MKILRFCVIVAVLILTSCGPGFVKTATPPATATPTPGPDPDVIAIQALASSIETFNRVAENAISSDLAAVHPTDTPVPTLTPAPTPQPSAGERVVKQATFPVLLCGFSVGVVFLATLAILAWESNRRRQDDALRRQQELDEKQLGLERMRLECEMLQVRNKAEARLASE